jgi:DNA modification methylase
MLCSSNLTSRRLEYCDSLQESDLRRRPGEVRDAIVQALENRHGTATVQEITNEVAGMIGAVPASSVRSYLRLNTPELFARTDRAQYRLRGFDLVPDHYSPNTPSSGKQPFVFGRATLHQDECQEWLQRQPSNSIHAVVTDPPYGLIEYSDAEQDKLRAGKGGVWRIPPSFDGSKRSPLPRFTVLTSSDLQELDRFFAAWARSLIRVLVPGANVVVASNPLLSYVVSGALSKAGLERRGEIARLVMTMRGGDRPKAAHVEFSDVSVMPRSMWEPWLLFRKPIDGRVQDNLRRWGTGGFRRVSDEKPFGDVIESAPTRASEREHAPHPSLKPQAFLRKIVRGVLPLGKGIILDPFAGSASTLAAAEAVGYSSVGVERDAAYFELAKTALPKLAGLAVS